MESAVFSREEGGTIVEVGYPVFLQHDLALERPPAATSGRGGGAEWGEPGEPTATAAAAAAAEV
jgi:hypothetical protein